MSEKAHPSAETGEQSLVIECTQTVQLLHRRDERLHRRRVHEVERQQVVDAHCLQRQHGAGEVRPLDLRHVRRHHLVAVRSFRVQSVALAGPGATRSARPLFCLRLISSTATTFSRLHIVLKTISRRMWVSWLPLHFPPLITTDKNFLYPFLHHSTTSSSDVLSTYMHYIVA